MSSLNGDAAELPTLTMRPAGASRSSGSIAWVTAATPNTIATKSSPTCLSTPRPVHVVEVLDHPGLLRRPPSQPLLRQLA
jgi:hypothetical protein